MLIATRFAAPDTPATDILELPCEARCKSRQRLRLLSGEEFGYNFAPGTCLRQGDKLLLTADDGARRVVEIAAAVETLVEARGQEVLQLTRAAYHLGNRHAKVEVGADVRGHYLRLPPDQVLEEMLLRLGCTVDRVEAPFQPEGGAYGGHEHGRKREHSQPPETPGPRIHEFR